MTVYWDNFSGSSTANLAFGALLVVIIYLKRRIKISRCKTNCHWFECESQLDDLVKVKTSVNTQRGMIADIQKMIMEITPNSQRNSRFDDIVLRTPSKRIRAISV